MLDIVVKFFCAIMLTTVGFFIVQNIQQSNIKFLNKRTLFLLFIMSVLTYILHKDNYGMDAPIVYLIFIIVIYQRIFRIPLAKAVIVCSIMMAILILSDAASSVIMINLATIEEIRTVWYYMLLGNILVCAIGFGISVIPFVKKGLSSFVDKIKEEKYDSFIWVILLVILALSTLTWIYVETFEFSSKYVLSILLMGLFLIILAVYIRERNYNKQINVEYQMLWDHVEVYENAIESDRLTYHELKNTLGSLRNLTTNNKMINRIDEILQDVNVVDDEWIEELKNLPKGAIKALLYYKMSVARNKKIHIVIDVSPKVKKKIVPYKDSKDLCHLLGIYIDNAIESASISPKKEVAIEIYILKGNIAFTISNTFDKMIDLESMNKRGYSTKGKGRGNGLAHAMRIINKNENYSFRNQIKDGFYIIQLGINILDKQ